MSSPATTAGAATINESMIAIKLSIDGTNRKFKLPLRDLVAPVFADKIRSILQVEDNQKLLLERFSDSGNAYVPLEPSNACAYKQLYRAGKAKQKLKLRATLLLQAPEVKETSSIPAKQPPPGLANYGPPTYYRGNMSNAMNTSRSHDRPSYFKELAQEEPSLEAQLHRLLQPHRASAGGVWQVFCNNCDKAMADSHFHCSICDDGDYDLCNECVKSGVSCRGDEHWLIKRFVKDGKVVNSTTETIAPRSSKFSQPATKQEVPGALKVEPKFASFDKMSETRTCNACVTILPEEEFVTCTVCLDVDYCVSCFKVEETGHHPAHAFQPAVPGARIFTKDNELRDLCKPNRNITHAAICDVCESSITGIRYKCLSCPDFDVCQTCHPTSSLTHPHRFVPIYEPLSLPVSDVAKHYGIYCDGKACTSQSRQSYIRGIRYKCAICPDFDLCGNCEAHPDNNHNETHPMLKLRKPLGRISCSAYETQPRTGRTVQLGDPLPIRPRVARRFDATASTPTPATHVPAAPKPVNSAELEAHFVKDVVADGTSIAANSEFVQTWTLRNPGPHAWPAGVAVCYTGGDHMVRTERTGYTTAFDLAAAQKSNATTQIVPAGQTYDFSVNMRAPSKAGKHISYWRAKAADGTPFGHKLWCDIEVKREVGHEVSTSSNAATQAVADAFMQGATMLPKLGSAYAQAAAHDLRNMQATVEDADDSTSAAAELHESQVVMPTLERDGTPSASNSMHSIKVETAPESVAATETKSETDATTVATEDKVDDLDSVDFESAATGSIKDEDDDGFLTDEEYDILDASDEEGKL